MGGDVSRGVQASAVNRWMSIQKKRVEMSPLLLACRKHNHTSREQWNISLSYILKDLKALIWVKYCCVILFFFSCCRSSACKEEKNEARRRGEGGKGKPTERRGHEWAQIKGGCHFLQGLRNDLTQHSTIHVFLSYDTELKVKLFYFCISLAAL